MRFLLSWIIPAFVFFSVISTKREVYLVPLYPALAILTASSAHTLLPSLRTRWMFAGPAVWATVLVALAAAPFILLATPYADLWSPSLLVLSAWCLSCAAWTGVAARRREWSRFPYVLGAQMVVLLIVCGVVGFPIVNPAKSSKKFAAPIRTLAAAGPVTIFSAAFVREEYVFYSGALHTPLFVEPGAAALESRLGATEARELAGRLPGHFGNAVERITESAGAAAESPTVETVRELCAQTAIDLGVPTDLLPAWETEIDREAELAQRAFTADTPAVLLVSIEHWPWVRSLLGQADDFILLKRELVTTREMLMFGNRPAADILVKESGVESRETWSDDSSLPTKSANLRNVRSPVAAS